MQKFVLGRLLLLATIMLMLATCGGATPQDFSDLPVFPDLELYNGAAETTLDGMWVAALLARAELPAERTVQYYWKPRAISWESVAAFYTQNLDAGWQRDANTPLISGERWTRSTNGGSQILVINEIGIGDDQGAIVVVLLATE